MSAAKNCVLNATLPSHVPTVPQVPGDPRRAWKEEVARTSEHVAYLRRRFGSALDDPEEVVAELHADTWERVCAGASAEQIHAAYTPVALCNRGRDALRRQRCAKKYRDRFESEVGLGHRRISPLKEEKSHVAGKHYA